MDFYKIDPKVFNRYYADRIGVSGNVRPGGGFSGNDKAKPVEFVNIIGVGRMPPNTIKEIHAWTSPYGSIPMAVYVSDEVKEKHLTGSGDQPLSSNEDLQAKLLESLLKIVNKVIKRDGRRRSVVETASFGGIVIVTDAEALMTANAGVYLFEMDGEQKEQLLMGKYGHSDARDSVIFGLAINYTALSDPERLQRLIKVALTKISGFEGKFSPRAIYEDI